MTKSIKIIDYLLTRLGQVGVTKIFGVPGDFNLVALDSVEDHKTIEWVGCANELNASYAADGYSRVQRNLGVLFTTFGVGELSAVNGIAGAFSERVPVLHIVGVPSIGLQSKGAMLHHTLGDNRFDAYSNIYSNVTIAQAILTKPNKKTGSSVAGEEIDRVITAALKSNRPSYLTLPTDLIDVEIPSEPLDTPLTMDSIWKRLSEPKVSDKVQNAIIKQICEMYAKATKPIVLVDACAIRYGVTEYAKELIDKTGMTFFTSPMGKTALNESHPSFGGIYVGDITIPSVKEAVESADFTLYIGSLKSDFNTGSFSYSIPPENTVELHSDHTTIQYAEYPKAGFQALLPLLIPELEKVAKQKKAEEKVAIPDNAGLSVVPKSGNMTGIMKQDEFWPLWGEFLKAGDVVLADTGTSSFGILDVRFPVETKLLTQILYGSIGWATGATLGAAMAAKEAGRRTILFTGDGSIQLTVQEVSTMIRHGLTPILVILNNSGYTIEKKIHGENRKYNDIKDWDWQALLNLFKPAQGQAKSYRVENREELEALFADGEFAKADKIQLVEVILDPSDAPRALREQAKKTEEANAEAE